MNSSRERWAWGWVRDGVRVGVRVEVDSGSGFQRGYFCVEGSPQMVLGSTLSCDP